MTKAIFFNVPAHGHINPSLPLVAELVQLGHEITYFASEHYRERIEAVGATVEIYDSIHDDYFESRGLDGSTPQEAAKTLLTTTTAVLTDLRQRASELEPDYILYDCMCPWGYFLAQIMQLPSVSSASLMPLSPRMMMNLRVLRIFLPTLIKGFRVGNEANRLSRDLGKQYDVKPLNMINVLNAPGDLIISYSSDAFVPHAQTLPDNVKFIGWTLQENQADELFIHDSERPLVYVSLGTVSNDNADFFRTCIDALKDAPYEVLITTGGGISPDIFGALPENITVESWVPQSQVLQQSAVFITHGGINSIHEGLYCDLPLLVVPQQAEQTFNAMRVVDLGAGLMLKLDELSATAIRERVNTLLSHESYARNAKRVGGSLRSAGGVKRAVDEIEALVKGMHGT